MRTNILNDPFEPPSVEEIQEMDRQRCKPLKLLRYPVTLSSVKYIVMIYLLLVNSVDLI